MQKFQFHLSYYITVFPYVTFIFKCVYELQKQQCFRLNLPYQQKILILCSSFLDLFLRYLVMYCASCLVEIVQFVIRGRRNNAFRLKILFTFAFLLKKTNASYKLPYSTFLLLFRPKKVFRLIFYKKYIILFHRSSVSLK